MNIGIDIRPLLSPIRTGVGEYTYELLNAIFQIDRQNQYFLFYNSYKDLEKYLPTWKYENVHFIKKNWPNKLFNFCQKFLKWPKIDTFAPQKLDYFFSPNLNFTALSKKTKHILTVHDLSFELFPEYFSFKQKLWHRLINPKKQCCYADIILTPSVNTKRDLINFYKLSENKIKIIYPGLSSVFNEPQKQNKNLQLPDNYILFLGALEPRKNILGTILAFEQAFTSLPLPYSLVIAGAPGWKNKDIFEKIEKSPLTQKITFVGYVKNEDKPELYNRAAAFIYPSFYEGFGFPVLEAMHCRVPVITSNASSLVEITSKNAYLVDPNKTKQISEGLIKILNDQNIKNNLVSKAKIQAEKFSWNSSAKEFLNILK